jgi:signal transduction histidine kinase
VAKPHQLTLGTAAGGAVLVALAVAAERVGNVPFPRVDLFTGCALLLAGLVALRVGQTWPAAALLLLAGVTWFVATADLVGSVTDHITFVHRALVLNAVLVASGRARNAARLVVVSAAYVASVNAERAFSTDWLVVVAAGATAVLATDASRVPTRWHFCVPAALGIWTWTTAIVWLRPNGVLDPAQRSALYGMGLALAAAAVAARPFLTRAPAPAMGDVVRDGGTGDVRVGFRDDPREPFLDITGAALDLTDRSAALTVAVDGGGETAIVHPGAATATGSVRTGLIEAASLLRAHRDALAAQRAQAHEIAESERRIRAADEVASAELARELEHSVVVMLDRASGRLASDASETAATATAALDSIVAELRTVAAGLVAVDLSGGLGQVVEALAARTALPVRFAIDRVPLEPATATTLYFVVAEAMTNAVRHGRPGTIDVRLVGGPTELELTVTDDGAGGAAVTRGGGLDGLRQRLAALDGTLTVAARRGGGTVVTARLPVPAAPGDISPPE